MAAMQTRRQDAGRNGVSKGFHSHQAKNRAKGRGRAGLAAAQPAADVERTDLEGEDAEAGDEGRRARAEKPEQKRRRLIDPTTCERDYAADEVEFMRALDEYKRKHHRNFPTCSEVLEVLKSLGYRKESSQAAVPA